MGSNLRGSRPGERRGGRKKGTPNKFPAELKDMVLQALSDAGGVRYLKARATDTPGPFLALVGKLLPTQVTGKDGKAITVEVAISAADGEL